MTPIENQLCTWLHSGEYDALFTRLCCGHFALAAEQSGIGSLHYLRSKMTPCFLGHVFVIDPSGIPFDIRGFRDVIDMKQEMTWCIGHPIKTDQTRIVQEIGTLDISDDYHEIVHHLANELVTKIWLCNQVN